MPVTTSVVNLTALDPSAPVQITAHLTAETAEQALIALEFAGVTNVIVEAEQVTEAHQLDRVMPPQFTGWKLDQLKRAARALGLSITGSKIDIAYRIVHHENSLVTRGPRTAFTA